MIAASDPCPDRMHPTRFATRLALLPVALACAVGAVSASAAEQYPTRPIRWLVPFTAGGTADLLARALGPKLTEAWGQTVVIDNRSGAGGNLATEMVARAAPDGYTLLLGFIANLAIGPSVYAKLPFDPVKDFAPITQLAALPNLLVVHPSVPAKGVKEFVAFARANPGKVTYSSASIASPGHLLGELMKTSLDFEMQHVPYKGGS